MKNVEKSSSDGTTAEQSTNADSPSVSHPIAKPLVICGCRVRLTHFDAEDGYPVEREGIVVNDLEPMFYKPNVNVKLDSGQTVYDYPKRLCVVLGNHI